jgi:hypothetical protein
MASVEQMTATSEVPCREQRTCEMSRIQLVNATRSHSAVTPRRVATLATTLHQAYGGKRAGTCGVPDLMRPLLRNETERRFVMASIPVSILGHDSSYHDFDIRDFSRPTWMNFGLLI